MRDSGVKFDVTVRVRSPRSFRLRWVLFYSNCSKNSPQYFEQKSHSSSLWFRGTYHKYSGQTEINKLQNIIFCFCCWPVLKMSLSLCVCIYLCVYVYIYIHIFLMWNLLYDQILPKCQKKLTFLKANHKGPSRIACNPALKQPWKTWMGMAVSL